MRLDNRIRGFALMEAPFIHTHIHPRIPTQTHTRTEERVILMQGKNKHSKVEKEGMKEARGRSVL